MQIGMSQKQHTVLLFVTVFLSLATCDSILFWFVPNEPPCESTQFKCLDNTCINNSSVCDGQPNCSDDSDEEPGLCEYKKCKPPNWFKCADGKCLHANSSLCDGLKDCNDGSDEVGCNQSTFNTLPSPAFTCSNDYFRCSNGQCIPLSWLCDGTKDCPDDESAEACAAKKGCEDHEFMCTTTKQCIPKSFRCDNFKDCSDGTDELHCEHLPVDMENCNTKNSKFACKDNYKCIDMTSVCDGKSDCYDNSDESGYCQTSTANACPNCTDIHRCVNTPEGGVCLCSAGYTRGNHNDCLDVNECEKYGICDQKCSNTPGSYYCGCDPNYILLSDGRTCVIKEGEGTLIYAAKDTIKGFNLKSHNHHTYFENLTTIIGITAIGNELYWTSVKNGTKAIMRSTLDNKDQYMVVTNGVGLSEDVAVDWITHNVYFSDVKYKHISVCSNDGYLCTILHSEVDKPRDIALIPEQGLMFWTDWGKKPHIGRSGMDGSNCIEFVSSEIMWPNGVAVDLPNERLYWVDARLERIETIKLDQTDRRVVLADSVPHPFSVTVFENKLYWSDFQSKEIHSCNKFTGKDRESIVREFFERIHGIHIRHPLLEQTRIPNPCNSNYCSDLCLLTPGETGLNYACACPTHKNLTADGRTCSEISEIPVVVAAVKHRLFVIEHNLLGRSKIRSTQFSDDMYITAMTYNSRRDTILIADLTSRSIFSWKRFSKSVEPFLTHGLGPISSMEYDHFGNNLYWCDEDTLSIEVISLATLYRTVIIKGSSREIPNSLALASEYGFVYIAFSSFFSKVHIDRISMDGNESTRKRMVDDLVGPVVHLHYSKEMKRLFWVDATTGGIGSTDIHGNDRRDLFMTQSPSSLTTSGSIIFWANTNSPIITWHNFYTDDYSETLKLDNALGSHNEIILTSIDRPENMRQACAVNNGGCTHLCLATQESRQQKVCACPAGYSISVDGLTCLKPKSCSLDEFQCFTGECIPMSDVCNNHPDCIHGDDEHLEHCNAPKCPPEQFLCLDQKRCIDRKLKCDGRNDCDDKSDEVCHVNCTAGEFTCDSGECIDIQFRCDGKVDCRDAHDEFHCSSISCSKNEFQCSSGQCIPKEWECDKESDCVDGSDEMETCERNECFPHEFHCSNDKCIDVSLTCNGFDDCGDDSDEEQCLIQVPHDKTHHDYVYKLCNSKMEFFCASNERHCVPISARCNGTKECVRGEDEENCLQNPCPANEFFCIIDNKCIPVEWVCDHKADCGDGSDEAKNACLNKPTPEKPCPGFRCNNGECITLSKVCDKISDCSDMSDEGGKCNTNCDQFGCSQKCFKMPKGPECRCKNGYKLSSDNKTCIDVNECEMDICAQNCTNTPGGFSCACYSPEYKLRPDRVSCKALGQSLLYVVASKNMLFITSNNMKHTGEINLGQHLFNSIIRIDVDVHHNWLFVQLETGLLKRISLDNKDDKIDFINPQLTDFSVDWITKAVYWVHDHRAINVSNLNVAHRKEDLIVIQLYTTQDLYYIWSLSVDPVAGYLFWFESEIDSHNNIGMIKRADCTGANVRTLLSDFVYPVRQLVIDSFGRHLYWFDTERMEVRRMDYDGSRIETVFYTENEVINAFTFFENSIYSVSPGLIPIRKCRIYGLPPKKCELMKLNMHNIRHFKILQTNRQRNIRNECENNTCSQSGLCLRSPSGAQCVCLNGKVPNENEICTKTGSISSSFISRGDSKTVSTYFTYFVIVCFIVGLIWMTFSHFSKRKSEILHRLHFHNPVYDMPNKSKASASEALLNAEEHCYDNPICEESKSTNMYNNNETTASETTKMYLKTLEGNSDHNELITNYLRTSKESLFVK